MRGVHQTFKGIKKNGELKMHVNNKIEVNAEIKTKFINLRDEIMCAMGFVDGIGEGINEDMLYCVRTEIIIAVCDLFHNLSEKYDDEEEVAKELDNTKEKIVKLVDTTIKSLTE